MGFVNYLAYEGTKYLVVSVKLEWIRYQMSQNVKKLEDLQAELAKLQLEEEKVKEKESQLKKENREKPEKKALPSPVD